MQLENTVFDNYMDIKYQHISFLEQLERLKRSPIDYRKFLCLVMNKLIDLYENLPIGFFKNVDTDDDEILLGAIYIGGDFDYDDFKIAHMYDEQNHRFYISYKFNQRCSDEDWVSFLNECGFNADGDTVFVDLFVLQSFIDVFDFRINDFKFENMTNVFSDKLLETISKASHSLRFEPDEEEF